MAKSGVLDRPTTLADTTHTLADLDAFIDTSIEAMDEDELIVLRETAQKIMKTSRTRVRAI